MKMTTAILFAVLIAVPAQAQEFNFLPQGAGARQNSRENELYQQGTAALNASNWSQAVSSFDQAASLNGSRADAALYWKAYAQSKAGQRSEAQATIRDLQKRFPQSRWNKEASALDLETRSSGGEQVRPEAQADEDLKLLAIQGMANADPARAVPLLQQVLQKNTNSAKVKERALFVLSQIDSPEAATALAAVAKGQQHPELQSKAIRFLGIMGSDRSDAMLAEIYGSSANAETKKNVLRAMGIGGNRKRVLAIAQQEKDPEMLKEAIHSLGIMGAHSELRGLYAQLPSVEAKGAVLHSMGIGGDAEGLSQIAQTEQNADLRGKAIHSLGITGGGKANQMLLQMYGREQNVSVKKQIVQAMFISGDGANLVSLARREQNREMRDYIVQKLSVMGGKEAEAYMIELLKD